MTRDNFEKLYRILNKRRPWTPYTLELVSGSRIEVNHPESLEMQAEVLVCQHNGGAVGIRVCRRCSLH